MHRDNLLSMKMLLISMRVLLLVSLGTGVTWGAEPMSVQEQASDTLGYEASREAMPILMPVPRALPALIPVPMITMEPAPVFVVIKGVLEPALLESRFPRINTGRKFLGNGYLALTETIDNFFAGKELERETNKSHLKLVSKVTTFQRSRSRQDFTLRGKFDLPATQRRFQFFVESKLNEEATVEERSRSISKGDRIKEEDSVAGFELSDDKPLSSWRRSLGVGAKLNKSVDPFIRFRMRKTWRLNEHWSSYFRQDLWYLDGIGWGETSRLEFTRKLNESMIFQLTNVLEVRDEKAPVEYVHVWQLDQIITDRYGMNYQVGFLGEGVDANLLHNRFINVSWRWRMIEDWAFLHLTPELFYDEDKKYRSEASLTLKLEVFLTD